MRTVALAALLILAGLSAADAWMHGGVATWIMGSGAWNDANVWSDTGTWVD